MLKYREPQGKGRQIEILGIVVRIRDSFVNRGMKPRHHPTSCSSAGDDVKQSEALVLRHAEAGLRRDRVVGRPPCGSRRRGRTDSTCIKRALCRHANRPCFKLGRSPRDPECHTRGLNGAAKFNPASPIVILALVDAEAGDMVGRPNGRVIMTGSTRKSSLKCRPLDM